MAAQAAACSASVEIGRGRHPRRPRPRRLPAARAAPPTTGSHTLRVYEEGFEPFEARVEVAAGQTVSARARLRRLVEAGRLSVVESTGKVLEVLLDGSSVGATPWEGSLFPAEALVSPVSVAIAPSLGARRGASAWSSR